MKKIMILLSIGAALVLGLLVASAHPLDFLDEYKQLSSGWHTASLLLRIVAAGISVLSAITALIQAKDFKKKGLITVILSVSVGVINGVMVVFFADFKTYEKAYVIVDTEIKNFQATFDEVDLGDEEISREFRDAKLDLIQKFQKIRLGLIEGKLAVNLDLVPKLYAQDRAWQIVKPRDAENYLYATGSSKGRKSLSDAKKKAIEEANKTLVKNLSSEIDQALARQGLNDSERKLVLDKVLNKESKAQLLKFAEQSESKFAKTKDGYSFFVVSRIPRSVVAYVVEDAVASADTLTTIKGFSQEHLMMEIGKEGVEKY